MRPVVLVVDDEPRNRDLARAVLERHCDVVEAGSAPEAYERLAQGGVDLVLLDVLMPGESGIEACQKIKERNADGYLPVIMLTALAEQSDRNAGLDAGADDFITKPFDKRELQLRVQAFLKLRAQDLTIRSQRDLLHRLHLLKDDLISLLVHDLRNPLAGVLGILSVLHEGARNEQERLDIEMAQRSGERLRMALDDMLQIRLLEEGKLTAKREQIASRLLVDEVMAFAGGIAKERGIAVRSVGDDCALNVDARLVVRALENLVVNALKHAPRSSEVEVETRVAQQGRVTFAVHDRGPGVPDAAKSTLFQKFGALDPEASRERRGFGLGLYLVDLVARAHDGGVEVKDRPGGGATFSLTLTT